MPRFERKHKKLGLRASPQGVQSLRFASFLGEPSILPTVPAIFGHYPQVSAWGMLGNDNVGDCTLAGAAHAVMLWNAAVGLQVKFAERDVLADYSAVSGYTPTDPATDTGADMLEVATFWKNVGVRDASGVRHHISADLSVDITRLDHVMLGAYLFGCIGLGLDLPGDAEDQFDSGKPWQLTGRKDSLGLHYVPLVGRNSLTNPLCVTWGRLHAMTPDFLAARLRECVVYISPEYVSKRTSLTPEQFDMTKLQTLLEEIG